MTKIEKHKELCEKLHETYRKKNSDYGDSFAKTREIVPNAILVRLHDKLNRVTALLSGNKQQVNDESVDDTLLDLANYALMELVERQNERRRSGFEEFAKRGGFKTAEEAKKAWSGHESTVVLNAQITVVTPGGRRDPFEEYELRGLAKSMKKQLNVDDVVITSAQVF